MAGMKWVFIMGLAGGLAGIFYLIVKQLLGRRFSMRSRCLFLSGIVVLFLIPAGMLLPAFPTAFGVSLVSLGQQLGSGAETANNPETIEQTGDGVYHMDETDVKPTAQPDSTSNPEENVKENMLAQILSWKVFAGLWAAVFFLSFFVKMLRYGQYCHECIKNSGPAEENIQNLAKEEKERLGIRQTVSIRCWKQNKAAKYPTFALGLIKPMILLPNSASVDDALRLTLDHELTHVKYYHLWLKAAVELTVSAHWYHPMAYWLRSECGRTCEYAVDEALAGEFSEERRRDYCQLLLNEAARQAAGCRFASDMVPEKKRLKERMMSIMRYQQVSKKVKAATGGLLAAGLAVCLFAEGCVGGQTQKQEAQQAVGAVYVGKDGLYYLDLKDRQVTKLDTGAEIKSPKISPKGSYVAYIKEDMLYLTKTNGGEPRKIADGEQSYCWYDDVSLLFCIQDAQNGEITRIWAGSEKTEKYGDPQYRYSNLTAGGNQMIYAQKSRMEEDGTKNIPLGVISLSMEDGKEEVLIEAVSYADERYQLGSSYQPQIEGISADGGGQSGKRPYHSGGTMGYVHTTE